MITCNIHKIFATHFRTSKALAPCHRPENTCLSIRLVKPSILFAIHSRNWDETGRTLHSMFKDSAIKGFAPAFMCCMAKISCSDAFYQFFIFSKIFQLII